MHANGFQASGVAEITAAAGVPKGSFYNHFVSKEAFGLEVLDRYFGELEELADATLNNRSRPALERLRAFFDALTASLEAGNWVQGCLMGNLSLEVSPSSEAIRSRLSHLFQGWSFQVATCIAEAQATGEIRNRSNAALLADFAVNAWEGAVLRMKVERNSRALDEVKAVLFSAVLA